jgi:hypothetical protein
MSDLRSREKRAIVAGRALMAGIFDVDGVLLASLHERAWREALQGITASDSFTTAMYQAHLLGNQDSVARLPFWSAWVCRTPNDWPQPMPSASSDG